MKLGKNNKNMEILVLKTNIELDDLPRLKQQLGKIPSIQKWTIDLDDCDHVLRIESPTENLLPCIIQEVSALGLLCVDLE
jgi:hypothetical protein